MNSRFSIFALTLRGRSAYFSPVTPTDFLTNFAAEVIEVAYED
jgi:hypothetical protein